MPWLIFNPKMLGIAFDWRLSVHGWGCIVTVHEFLLQLKLPWTYLTGLGPLCRHHSFTGRYWGTHHIAHVQPYFIVWCYTLSPQAILLRVVKRVWHPMFSQWWDQFHNLAKSYDFKIEQLQWFSNLARNYHNFTVGPGTTMFLHVGLARTSQVFLR